jgi:hypothetical protein
MRSKTGSKIRSKTGPSSETIEAARRSVLAAPPELSKAHWQRYFDATVT